MMVNSEDSVTHVFREIERTGDGVIIIIKNEQTAEQITLSMLSEIAAAKITTYRQLIIIAACYRQPKTVLVTLNS